MVVGGMIVMLVPALLMQAPAAAEETALRIESRPGATEVLVLTPGSTTQVGEQGSAKNAVIVLQGGSGQVRLGIATEGPDAGKLKVAGSLPIARRQELADKVGAVAILTQPSDRPVMDQEWRDSKEHVADIAAAVTVVQQRFPGAKVWLLGFSNGSWSAAHAGAQLQDRLAGVILMSVAAGAFKTEGFDSIRIPVLVVQHRRDSCLPYANIEDEARWHTLVTVDDSRLPRVRAGHSDCGGESAHAFHGSDAAVMAAVEQWIDTGKAPDHIDEENAKRNE
jgi:alpha/beta superfamily hydrolase